MSRLVEQFLKEQGFEQKKLQEGAAGFVETSINNMELKKENGEYGLYGSDIILSNYDNSISYKNELGADDIKTIKAGKIICKKEHNDIELSDRSSRRGRGERVLFSHYLGWTYSDECPKSFEIEGTIETSDNEDDQEKWEEASLTFIPSEEYKVLYSMLLNPEYDYDDWEDENFEDDIYEYDDDL